MKLFLFLIVVFMGIWIYFPEPRSVSFCYVASGSFDWDSRVCSHVTKNFCERYIGGEFSGCDDCDDTEIVHTRSCADRCKADCQTGSYLDKL